MAKINVVLMKVEDIERGMYVARQDSMPHGSCPGVVFHKVLDFEDNANTRTLGLDMLGWPEIDYTHGTLVLVGVEEQA